MKPRSSSGPATRSRLSGPNILFVIDTSGSMDTDVTTQVPVQPGDRLSGLLRRRPRLFQDGLELEQSAGLQQRKLGAARGFQVQCGADQHGARRAITSRTARPNGAAACGKASMATPAIRCWVECRADAGIHGNGVDLSRLWARRRHQRPLDRDFDRADRLECEWRQPGLRVLRRQLRQLAQQRWHDYAESPGDRSAGGDPDDQFAGGRRRGQRRP